MQSRAECWLPHSHLKVQLGCTFMAHPHGWPLTLAAAAQLNLSYQGPHRSFFLGYWLPLLPPWVDKCPKGTNERCLDFSEALNVMQHFIDRGSHRPVRLKRGRTALPMCGIVIHFNWITNIVTRKGSVELLANFLRSPEPSELPEHLKHCGLDFLKRLKLMMGY